MRDSPARRLYVVNSYLNRMAGTGKSKYLEPLKKILDGLSNETFVFFDTETTGLDQHDDQITEIAAVAVRGPDFEEIDSMEAKASLNDDTLRRIEEQKAGVGLPKDKRHKTVAEILEMNRYYDGESKGRPENDILIEFKDFCEKYNPVLVGHNPEFDLRMVGTKVGRIPNRGVWDTMLFARFFFHPMLLALEETGDPEAAKILSGIRGSKGTPHATLGKVLQALGQSIEGWHTALADVRSTVKAFRGIMDYVRAHLDLASTEAYGRHQSRAFKVVRDYKRGLVDRGENPGKI